MAYLDRREPAVYVDIEDKSYVEPAVESGRTVYSVILCDRGPSNQIVHVRSQEEFHNVFGRPNFLRTSQTHYQIDAALQYTQSTLVVRVTPDDAYYANSAIKENNTGEPVAAQFVFTNGLKEVTMQKLDTSDPSYSSEIYGSTTDLDAEIKKVQIGTWIYADGDNASVAAQVVNMETDLETNVVTLTLDRPYEGGSQNGTAYTYLPYSEFSLSDVDSEDLFTNPDGDVVMYFVARGAGKYYNKLCIRGTRNTDLEKYYLDENDEPRYKYLFMDLAIYEQADNGNMRIVEGPWVVSLSPRYPDDGNNSANGQVINPTTGEYIFIEDVINDNSNLVRCICSTRDPITDEPNAEFAAVSKLVDDEDKRLQIMLMLTAYTPIGLTNISSTTKGISLKQGSDGTGQYNTSGNIQPSDQLLGKVARAFGGQLTDKGIDDIRETVYPIFQPGVTRSTVKEYKAVA